MPSPHRLFHAIVVVGAALGGCGGKTDAPEGSRDAGVGSDRDPRGNDRVDAGADAAVATCAGPVTAPEQCASPADFFCEFCSPNVRRCRCDPTAPDDPTLCEKTQDYHCESYEPMTGCRCVKGSPATEADCASPAFFSCRVDEPPIGCDCVMVITK